MDKKILKKEIVIGIIFLFLIASVTPLVLGDENKNLNLEAEPIGDFDPEFVDCDTKFKEDNLYHPDNPNLIMGKLNQVLTCKKLKYDGSKEYDWYAVTWTVECVPEDDFLFGWILNSIDVDEICDNGKLIDYGPYSNTGGTKTVQWTIGVEAGYWGAMVSASYSEGYSIQEIQITILSDFSEELAKWEHLHSSGSDATQTYKPGIVFRVPHNMDFQQIKLRLTSLAFFWYLFPQEMMRLYGI